MYESHDTCVANEVRHKRVHTVCFHIYKVPKQAISVNLEAGIVATLKGAVTRKEKVEASGVLVMLFLDLVVVT